MVAPSVVSVGSAERCLLSFRCESAAFGGVLGFCVYSHGFDSE